MTSTRRSKNYLGTIPMNRHTDIIIEALRVLAKKRGAGLRIRPRLGKDNPNRHLYAVGGKLHRRTSQDIKIEHATRVDVYLRYYC